MRVGRSPKSVIFRHSPVDAERVQIVVVTSIGERHRQRRAIRGDRRRHDSPTEGATDAAIQIDSGGVSRLHARILVSGREARIEDLGSKNGTFVDGRPVDAPRLLNDGAEVRVGPIALTFRVAAPVDATETMI